MAFQISPGVNVSEIDLTTVVPSVLTTAGAFVGRFTWGPANKIKLIDSEINLVKTFGEPTSNTAIPFFTAANFLSYGNNLQVVRAVNANTKNSDSNGATPNTQVTNEDVYEVSYLSVNSSNTYGPIMARYPGALGNSLKVEVFDSANTTLFNNWTYKSYFTSAPGTSAYVSSAGGANDEIHIVVIDSVGSITGTAGTVLETYPFVSKAADASINGSSNYYKQVVFNNSKYVYVMDPFDYTTTSATWGLNSSTSFARIDSTSFPTGNLSTTLAGGTDSALTDSNLTSGWDLFKNKESVNISLVVTGDANVVVQQHVIDNVVNSRMDCVAFISPPSSNVVNQAGSETSNIQSWLSSLSRSSSYVVADSGWKYQLDKYNNTYRWMPLNADIAGLCVYTDTVRDPWFSPAGLNRGAIKNCIKLAWNPSKTYRDTLYAAGVNPVISLPGQGTVLFGDKTLQSKPSAFDRINVRRLFIVLEKAISTAAQYSLFELNDEFTRAQFVSLVSPFLRDVQGRRGITDFKVVCDTTNNTSQVIDSNQFVGDIYIKPARSINYIQLNFVAVATGVDFTTIVGKF
jgi:Phage tail sheath protein subtilisin-like domain/Phage tail sheath C-terminal domain